MIRYQCEQYGLPALMDLSELKEGDLVVPVTMMGAPLISLEKIPSGLELMTLVEKIKDTLGKAPAALLPAEIGGANAFTPFLIASQLGIPVLDADMIGRAFPALHMSSCYLANLPLGLAFQADSLGNSLVIDVKDPETLERLARAATIAMGSSSAVAFYLMDGAAAQKGLIAGSISEAIKIGMALDPTGLGNPIEKLKAEWGAAVLAEGILVDIDQSIEGGFLKGNLTLLTNRGEITVLYQNEYLAAWKDQKPLVLTPDIIVLLEKNSLTPLSSEGLRYGLQVLLMAFPSPKIWKTEPGLRLVGPSAFGYNTLFKSFNGEESL